MNIRAFHCCGLLSIMTLFLLSACGGGGGGSSATGGATTGMPSVATKIYSAVSASICPTGGIQVDAGIDDNGNSALDPSEVDSTQYVCNGTDGLSSLISIVSEPVGTNCANGGQRVNVGQDINRNDLLDAAEIASSAYICTAGSGTGDTIAPAPPANFHVVYSTWDKIALAWDPATDNNWVLGYKVYRDGQYRMFTGLVSLTDEFLTSSHQYCYNIAAVDISGNESAMSPQICIATLVNDIISAYSSFTYDANGNMIREVRYYDSSASVGADGLWFTADDRVAMYFSYTYDANGNMIREVRYSVGVDGLWFTADDTVSDYNSYTYDANGNMIREVYYNGAGADGLWFTADDMVNRYNSYTYDANGNMIREVRYSVGVDGLWFTADDTVSDYNSYTYDANGNMIREVYYNGAGVDGLWFTADDTVSGYYSYTYDANGNRIREVYYNGAGTDRIWFNV